ncbi:hypothetical protein ACQP1V_43115 (plasmid) [Microtetraspora malaysiensis]|uniref:hypothetical protein n=1 Tax=Microtetraspora malaysiensis TaxID=161358 RepID=UPI003D92FCD4
MPVHELRWEDPKPRSAYRRGDYADIANQLRQAPGRWAVILEHPAEDGRRKAANLHRAIQRGGRGFTATDGAFAVTTRTVTRNGRRVIRLYARYIPADSATAIHD